MSSPLIRKLGDFFFRYRSYIPIPFLIVTLYFMEPTLSSIVLGFIVALCGELIRIWSVSFAGSETRTTSGVGGTYLVTQGPYSFVRNPLYIGNIMIYTGIGIMSLSLFPYLQIAGVVFFSFQYYCIILAEEDFLAAKFPSLFPIYYSKVNRFLPLINRIPDEIRSQLKLNVTAGLKSEKRSIQAFTISAAIIIVYYFLFGRNV